MMGFCWNLRVVGAFALLLTSCATPGPIDTRPAPRAIELHDEPQISTYHFPRGVYSLVDSDATGYYYSAPRQVTKHGFPGSLPYDGGLFVDRRDHTRLRAYLIWAGGRTKIGNLSNADYTALD
jgi:hypothetical protein